jgi:hypothetical protein
MGEIVGPREIGFVARREGPSLNPSPLRKSFDLIAMCADLTRNSPFHDVAITIPLGESRPHQLFRVEGGLQNGIAPRNALVPGCYANNSLMTLDSRVMFVNRASAP